MARPLIAVADPLTLTSSTSAPTIGAAVLTKASVGFGNVDNAAEPANRPLADLATTNILASGSATVSGEVLAASGSIATVALKSTGKLGMRIQSAAYADLAKFWVSGTADLYSNVNVGGTLTVTNFSPSRPYVGFVRAATSSVATESYQVGFKTTGVSITHSANGTYQITTPPHPNYASVLTIASPCATSSEGLHQSLGQQLMPRPVRRAMHTAELASTPP